MSNYAAELTELLSHHWVQAGLIRVVDNYGDYGFCGFYALSNVFEGAHLVHFCFSCRILNMGVEQWVYARLGRPPLHVVGDVLADLKADFVTPDWISYETNANVVNLHAAGSKVSLGGITARGGCDLSAITHYFAPLFEHVVGEFSVVRNGIVFRTDHSLLTAAACRGLTYEEKQVFQSVGYVEADFTTDLTTGLGPQAIRLLSFLGDAYMPVYRHRSSGARVPISGLPVGGIAALSGERRSRVADIEAVDSLRDLLEREFEYEGVTGKDLFQRNVLTIMDAIPDGHIVVVEPNDSFSKDGTLVEFNPRLRNVNDWLREVMNGRDGLSVARLQSFVAFEKEAFSANHFDRMVYFRFFQWLCESVCSTSRNGGIAEQRVAELGRHV